MTHRLAVATLDPNHHPNPECVTIHCARPVDTLPTDWTAFVSESIADAEGGGGITTWVGATVTEACKGLDPDSGEPWAAPLVLGAMLAQGRDWTDDVEGYSYGGWVSPQGKVYLPSDWQVWEVVENWDR